MKRFAVVSMVSALLALGGAHAQDAPSRRTVTVRVVDAEGRPVTQGWVAADLHDARLKDDRAWIGALGRARLGSVARIDSSGRAVVTVPKGCRRLIARSGFRVGVVKPGRTLRLTHVLNRGKLELAVRGGGGAIVHYRITPAAYPKRGMKHTGAGTRVSCAKLTFGDLPPGAVRVEVWSSGASFERTVKVAAQRSTKLIATLR